MSERVKHYYKRHENAMLPGDLVVNANESGLEVLEHYDSELNLRDKGLGYDIPTPPGPVKYLMTETFNDIAIENLFLRMRSSKGAFILTTSFNPVKCIQAPGAKKLDRIIGRLLIDTNKLKEWQDIAAIFGQTWKADQLIFYAIYRAVHCFDYDNPYAGSVRFKTDYSGGFLWPYQYANPLSIQKEENLYSYVTSLLAHLGQRVFFEGLGATDLVLRKNIKIVPSGCNRKQVTQVIQNFGLSLKTLISARRLEDAFNWLIRLLTTEDPVTSLVSKSKRIGPLSWELSVTDASKVDQVLDFLDIYYFITSGFTISKETDFLTVYDRIELARYGKPAVDLSKVEIVTRKLQYHTVFGLPGEATILDEWRTLYNRPAMVKYIKKYLL